MLHACFQILQDCVEKEKVDTHCSYEAHKDFVDEVRLLYKWWLKRKNDDSFDNDDFVVILLNILNGTKTATRQYLPVFLGTIPKKKPYIG